MMVMEWMASRWSSCDGVAITPGSKLPYASFQKQPNRIAATPVDAPCGAAKAQAPRRASYSAKLNLATQIFSTLPLVSSIKITMHPGTTLSARRPSLRIP